MQFYSLSYFFLQKIQNDMMSQIDVHVYVHVYAKVSMVFMWAMDVALITENYYV